MEMKIHPGLLEAGQRVQIRTWEDMSAEFMMSEPGTIDLGRETFNETMEKDLPRDRVVRLHEEINRSDNKYRFNAEFKEDKYWAVCPEMVQRIVEPAPETEKGEKHMQNEPETMWLAIDSDGTRKLYPCNPDPHRKVTDCSPDMTLDHWTEDGMWGSSRHTMPAEEAGPGQEFRKYHIVGMNSQYLPRPCVVQVQVMPRKRPADSEEKMKALLAHVEDLAHDMQKQAERGHLETLQRQRNTIRTRLRELYLGEEVEGE